MNSDKSLSGTEQDLIDEEVAVIDPSRGWASETVDDRHSTRGSVVGYVRALYRQHSQIVIEIRSLQPATERDRAQLDPRVAGLLVVALGLVLVGVITVGAIAP